MAKVSEPTIGDILEDMERQLAEFVEPYIKTKTTETFLTPERSKEPMTEQEYNQIPAVRRSDLILLRKSPMHLAYAKSLDAAQEQPTPAQLFGAAAHKFLLEGAEAFVTEYAVAPNYDKRTKAGKEAFAAFQEESKGRTVITLDDYQQIIDMHAALQQHEKAAELLTGEHEQTFVWNDPETEEDCKIRLDCLTYTKDRRPLIVDYKTVSSCEPGVFERETRTYGYKVQAGMYTEGLAISSNFMIDASFAFVCQEKKPPYAVRVYYCDPGFIEQGNRQYHELLRYYHQCRQQGEWPGYADGYLLADEREEVAE